MSNWTQQEVEQAMEKVKELSVKESAFRKLALENPNEAIKKAAGKEVPAGIVIKFIENAAGAHMTVVLPDAPASGELSEGELGSVAGGATGNQQQPGYIKYTGW
ncbi:MAG: NHLP leader peptide family RiPP precursor [Clostridia bacterium]|jgi:hypothetical protein|nr:NHLP leader peptide family RiPP precursor [Clostridia bacterium]